ncbi:outer membrane protein transport protein [Neisseria leonii]|uniref:Outer membrane protein transport protein n=1 Tax=Neisseria leonii TaxID=2995413 RepID=A0A9X4IDV1_9NEIS|nr:MULTISPECIES: outer membrane protein transport protein [unclassified Neisseria]MDD9325796.1 outer membrane protein transport protein [Neisseria sp. 3986]MDD9328076.1 outer membrane protein transport protein [Neisseria sp. 51.81]
MKRKVVAALLIGSPILVQAAALERTPQSTDFIFDKGNRVEAGISFVRPDISGKALNPQTGKFDADTGSVANNFNAYALQGKFQLNDALSLGLKYEQPFGIDVAYGDKAGVSAGLRAKATVHNLTALAAYKTPANITVFGGPAYQRLDGHAQVNVPVFGTYKLELPTDGAWGYVAGAAYEKPEIALRASLTYRSQIKYKGAARESAGPLNSTNPIELKIPRSVNVNLQTGIAPKTLLLAGVRWTDWSNFKISPKAFGTVAKSDLVTYEKDSFQYSLGVGRQLTDKLTGVVIGTYDTGAGSVISPLGPTNRSYTLQLLGKYQVNDNVDIGLGAQYKRYKDQETTSKAMGRSTVVGRFDGMNVWGVGARVGVKW